jgi:hypothetical protein
MDCGISGRRPSKQTAPIDMFSPSSLPTSRWEALILSVIRVVFDFSLFSEVSHAWAAFCCDGLRRQRPTSAEADSAYRRLFLKLTAKTPTKTAFCNN